MFHRRSLLALPILFAALAAVACGSGTPTATPTSSNSTPTAPVSVSGTDRETGEYNGIAFSVGEGSEITFTVEEQLASLPLPNDAVLRTTSLDGDASLDGGTSTIRVDLQSLASDSSLRDRYVSDTMFPGSSRYATLIIPTVLPLPEGFAAGNEAAATVEGTLNVKGNDVPVTFEVTARDDGDVVYILGTTTVTWEQLGVSKPSVRSVVSIEDDIHVEVLLALYP